MSVLDMLLYSVPGLMAYFWLEKFGHAPSRPLSTLEQTALIAVLWLPTTVMATVILYLLHMKVPSFTSVQYGKTSLLLALYLVICAFSSFTIAFMWAWIFHKGYHKFVNFVRKRLLGLSVLAEEPTVWDSFFKGDGSPRVLRVSNMGSQEYLIGEIANGPRVMSGDTSLILQEQGFWGQVVQKEDVRVDRIFLKTDAGLVIEELSLTHLKEIIERHDDLKELL